MRHLRLDEKANVNVNHDMNVYVNLGQKREREREYVTCCGLSFPKLSQISEGVLRSGARVPSLTRVAGHAQRSGQDGASRGGIRSRGERSRRRARPDSCRPRPACERFAGDEGIGRQGFVGLGGLRLAFGAAN